MESANSVSSSNSLDVPEAGDVELLVTSHSPDTRCSDTTKSIEKNLKKRTLKVVLDSSKGT